MVGVEHGARGVDVGGIDGALVPRQFQDGVEPGPDPARLGALLAGPLELADLAQRGLTDVVGHRRGLDPAAVVVRAFGLALAEFLADGGQLLAQQELALALVHALADVVADLVADLDLGQVLAGPPDELGQPGLDLGRLQRLPLLLGAQVAGPAGQVGQRGRLLDLLDRIDDLPGVAAFQHADDQGAVLLGQGVGVLRCVALVDDLGLHPQRGTGAGDAVTDAGAALGAQHGAGLATGQAAELLDRGHRAVRGVAVVEAGREQQPRFTAGLGRVDDGLGLLVEFDRHDHAGQDDLVRQRQHRQVQGLGHDVLFSHAGSCGGT